MKRREGRALPKRMQALIVIAILAVAVFGMMRFAENRTHRWIASASQSELENYVKSHPDQPYALRRLGVIDRNAGKFAEAAHLIQHAVETDPGDEANWVELSRTQNNDQDTIVKLEGYLRIVPGSPQIMAELARRKLQSGDISAAAALAGHAAEIAPESADAQRVLGDVTAAAGNWPQAEKDYRKSLSLLDDPETRLALARIWVPLQRYGEITEICSPIIDDKAGKSPDVSAEQRARALVYMAAAGLYEPLTAADFDKIQKQLREADGLGERLPQAERFLPPYLMGESMLKFNRPKEAIPYLERSTALAPMFAGSLYSLARAYRLAGDTAKADAAQARHSQLTRQLAEQEKPKPQ